ncbi:redox-sensing transcriptional repressor Rex [candidate division KSB1 bacterium]|nr:redox-sensing transcriptional repressor Rex [candidate division KSB1 bacterium]
MKAIPHETIGRLFPYFRALLCLSKEGVKVVSSARLAEVCHSNPAMIRKDFSFFGDFGKRGVGYDVGRLIREIRTILDLKPAKNVALIGTGHIGKALLSYPNFESEGFKIVMAFDNQPNEIGRVINGVTIENVQNLEERIKAENIHMVIVAVPEEAAPVILRRLSQAGVKAVLSFTPCQPAMPKNLKITCVDLSTEMARLVYYSSMRELHKT